MVTQLHSPVQINYATRNICFINSSILTKNYKSSNQSRGTMKISTLISNPTLNIIYMS